MCTASLGRRAMASGRVGETADDCQGVLSLDAVQLQGFLVDPETQHLERMVLFALDPPTSPLPRDPQSGDQVKQVLRRWLSRRE